MRLMWHLIVPAAFGSCLSAFCLAEQLAWQLRGLPQPATALKQRLLQCLPMY